MNDNLVSIVLPSYNGSKYIRQAIESVLSQTYKNWELILVDDCSNDETWSIMQNYKEQFPYQIRSIQHDTNQRLPTALNTGFATSKGIFLTWTSDDNWYRPNAIQEMVDFLNKKQEISLVYCDYSIVNENNKFDKIQVLPPENLMFRNIIGPCFMYRREVFEKIGKYSEKHFLSEDFEFWVRVARKYKLEPLHNDLYVYRVHKESLSSTKNNKVKHVSDGIKLNYARKLPFKVSNERKSMEYLNLLKKCIKRNDFQRTVQTYLQLIRVNPKEFFEVKRIIKMALRFPK